MKTWLLYAWLGMSAVVLVYGTWLGWPAMGLLTFEHPVLSLLVLVWIGLTVAGTFVEMIALDSHA